MIVGGVISSWSDESKSIELSKGSFSNNQISWTTTDGNITVTQHQGSTSSSVNSSYVSTPRVYKGHILSFEAASGYAIKSISIKCDGTYIGNSMTAGTVISGNTVTDNTTDVSRKWTSTSGGTHVISSVSDAGLSAIYIQNVASADNVQLRPVSISITYSSPQKKATTLTLSPSEAILNVGGSSITITPTVIFDEGTVETSNIVWVSGDMGVATVTDGIVTPVGVGKCTITASYAGDETYAAAENATCVITVNPEVSTSQAATPTFSVVGGTYKTTQNVSISSTGASYVWYTTNGEDPTAEGVTPTEVDGNSVDIPVNSSMTIKARGIDGNLEASALASVTYTIQPDAPAFSVNAGSFETAQSIELSQNDADGIYYTIDGSNPTESNTAIKYNGAIEVSSTTTIKASAYVGDFAWSEVAEATYEIVTVDTYIKVTDVSSLADGDKITFVNESAGKALGAAKTNNYNVTSVSISNNSFKLRRDNNDVTIMTLEKVVGSKTTYYYYFKNDDNKYIGSASSSNNNMTADTKSDNKKATITITSGNAEIMFKGSYSRNIVKYNTSSSLFSCYASTSTMAPVQIYKKVVVKPADLSFASATANVTYGSLFDVPALSNKHSASLTWTSSDEDVATVASDGTITLVAAGSTTITATATGEYIGSASYTLNVARAATSLSFAASAPSTYVGESTYIQSATINPAAADNTITYSFVGEHGDATINSSNGTITFNGYTGNLTIKASAEETNKYASPEDQTYVLSIVANPIASLVLSSTSETTIYGTSVILDGTFADGYLDADNADVEATGYNSAIADYSFDVKTGKITIVPTAVGQTTFTFNAKTIDGFEEGSTVNFVLTVEAPSSKTKAPASGNFVKVTSANNITDGQYLIVYEDDNVAFNGGLTTLDEASNTISIEITDGMIAATDEAKAAAFTINSSSIQSASGFYIGQATDTNGLASSKDEVFTNTFTMNGENVDISSGNAHLRYNATSGQERFRYFKSSTYTNQKAIQLYKFEKGETSIASVTTTGGLATYCYQYPLNLDGISGAKAYIVNNIDNQNEKVKLTQITGTIKGGVPFILKSDGDDATFEIPLADASATVPDGNPLIGTLAPTFVAQTSGDYTNFAYSKSNKCFVKLSDAGNTVPANRAYLPIKLGSNGVKSFALSFDTADGIGATSVAADDAKVIYNLSGQRVQKPRRGVNIINGKKVLVK